MLSPRQKLVYSPQTGDIKCYVTSGESEISWKDGKLIFNDTPLDEVLHMLGKRFNVEFVLSNKELKAVRSQEHSPISVWSVLWNISGFLPVYDGGTLTVQI